MFLQLMEHKVWTEQWALYSLTAQRMNTHCVMVLLLSPGWLYRIIKVKVKVKEADLYSAFIEVPYTEGTQVRITQCYLQTTPYLPLPYKHSPDGASQTEVADI